jgi:elongation factor 1-alpha
MTSFVNTGFIEKEQYYGNVEYKIKFESMDDCKIKKYATQMKFRLIEGNGEAIYLIGVQDNGQIVGLPTSELEMSTNIIHKIVNEIDSEVKQIIKINVENSEKKILMVTIKALFNIEDIFVLND